MSRAVIIFAGNVPTSPEEMEIPSIDAGGGCTCCGFVALDADDEPSGDELPCACMGDDCPECGSCLLAHCECDPGDVDEDQITPLSGVDHDFYAAMDAADRFADEDGAPSGDAP